MRYILAMFGDEAGWQAMTPEQVQSMVDRLDAYNRALQEAGVFVSAEGLQDLTTARTVRFGNGGTPAVSDGPYTDAKEQLVGFWLIDCKDADEAVEWTRKAPLDSGAIEIRPLVGE